MDAKPQKPLRALRILNDENAVPATIPAKTIHSRNKSSPALSTMAAAGAMKLAAKRSAFADVSNTAGNRVVKDDLLLPGKSGMKTKDGFDMGHIARKEAKLAQPLAGAAYRPLRDNAEVMKVISTVGTARENTTLPSKPVLDEGTVQRETQPPKAKATVDSIAEAPLEARIVVQHGPGSEHTVLGMMTEKPSSQPIVQQVQNLNLLPATEEPHVPQPKATNNSWAPTAAAAAAHSIVSTAPEDAPIPPPHGTVPASHTERPLEERVADAIKSTQLLIAQASDVSAPALEAGPPSTNDKALAVVQEPEEEWYEEEDEENYDEEGYVTARSFRSRENVTGNATTLLIPKASQKARLEIAAAKELVESMRTPEDVEDEKYDTSMVAEYGDEIFQYLREMEAKMQPNPHYMDYQTEIQWSMRSVLVDWIVQVHLRFGLLPETLFLCVNYIDRFLSAKVVSLNKLQLVGATALFVASKYEEINCPSVQEIVYMVDNGYSMDEVLKAERFMLSMLQFELGWPGPMSFLRRISKADDYDLETRTLAKYLLEVTVMDERFLGCPPSYTAAGAHCMARMMLQKGDWSPAHVYYSNYTYEQLIPLINLIFECCEDPQKHHGAIFEKYADKRYKNSSTFVSNQIRTQNFRLSHKLPDKLPSSCGTYGQLFWGQEYLPLPWQ